jgi:hypothetical protein
MHVVWTHSADGIESIWLARRKPGAETFGPGEQVANQGRRPSVVESGDTLFLAFERGKPNGFREVVVQLRPSDGEPETLTIADTERNEPIDVQVHALNGVVWVDWKHSDTELGYIRYLDGAWEAEPTLVPWSDPSWLGVEVARREIRLLLF